MANVDSETAGKIPLVISILSLFPLNSLSCAFFFFASDSHWKEMLLSYS